MEAWQATVQDEFGNIVFNPSVTVYEEDGETVAEIFNEDGSTKPNPFIGDLEGFVQFWAKNGTYKIVGQGGGVTHIWEKDIGIAKAAKFAAGTTPFDFGMEVDDPATHGPAIQAAIDYCHAQGKGTVWLPDIGVPYWASEKLIHRSGVSIRGHGGCTEIRAMPGMADTLLETADFASLMVTNVGTGGSQDFVFEDIILNGNRANNGADTDVAGDVLNLWGRNFKLRGVYIKDAPRHGLQAFYANDGVISGVSPFNVVVENLNIDVAGGHGIRWHISDSDWTNVKVASPSQLGSGLYDAVHVTQGIRWVNGAIWKKGFHANTHAYGVYNTGGSATFTGVNIEHGAVAGFYNSGPRISYQGTIYNTFGPDLLVNTGTQSRFFVTGQVGGGGASDSAIVNNSGSRNFFFISGTGGLAALRANGGVQNVFSGLTFNGTANPDVIGTLSPDDEARLSFRKNTVTETLMQIPGEITGTSVVSNVNDNSPSRLMKVGHGAMTGAQAPSPTSDLNTAQNANRRVITGSGATGNPIANQGWVVENIYLGSDNSMQLAYCSTFNGRIRMAIRHRNNTDNAWSDWMFIATQQNGASAFRPTSPQQGEMFFDNTIGKPIWRRGSNWVDASGAVV